MQDKERQNQEVQLIITFQSPTSLNHRIATSGPVCAEQLVMIGQRLLDEGRFAWAMERQRAAMEQVEAEQANKIVVPGPSPEGAAMEQVEAEQANKIVVPGPSPEEVERILRKAKGVG